MDYSPVVQQNQVSNSLRILVRDRTTGHAKTGLVAADLTFYYIRGNAAPVAFAGVDLAAIGSAFAAGGFKEYSAADAPGVYRLDVTNAAFASGATELTVGWKGANVEDDNLTVVLVNFDPTVIDKTGFKLAADGMADVPGYV